MIAQKMKENMKRDPEELQKLAEEQQQNKKVKIEKLSPYGPSKGQPTKKRDMKIPHRYMGLINQEALKEMEKELNVILTYQPGNPAEDREGYVTIVGTDPDISHTKIRLHMMMHNKEPPVTMYAPRDDEGNITVYMYVNASSVGMVIGKSGDKIKEIQEKTKAKVSVDASDADPNSMTRSVIFQGQEKNVMWAMRQVEELVDDGAPDMTEMAGKIITEVVKVANDKVGLVIGKGGDTIKQIQKECNVKLVVEQHPDSSGERPVTITGTFEDVQNAKEAVLERVNGRRGKYRVEDNGYDYAFTAQAQEQAFEQPQQQYDPEQYAQYYAQYYAQQGEQTMDPEQYAQYYAQYYQQQGEQADPEQYAQYYAQYYQQQQEQQQQ
ncbi:hypothetical protein EDD86DRAFT_206239 [Gorgonomyces haynaldii]|nr:hypothetical protein EDD86DRAFT_206239 [Gorgonomyces haynaldii]